MLPVSLPVSHVLRATMLWCVLLSACNLNRAPIASAELDSDGGDTGALLEAPDANVADEDANTDVALEADASVSDASLVDSAITEHDAGDAAVTANDAAVVEVDAYVPPPRYAGSCLLGCEFDESCVQTNGLLTKHSYCAQHCASDHDCAAGPTGASAPRCSAQGFCRIPCDAVLGKGCPTNMVCLDALLIVPGGDGTCAFRQ
jgi:hypothetical protein